MLDALHVLPQVLSYERKFLIYFYYSNSVIKSKIQTSNLSYFKVKIT